MFVGWCKATSLSLNGEQQLLGDNAKDIFPEVQLYWGVKSFNFTLCSDWVRVFSHIAGQAQGKATSVCQLVCLSVAPPLRSCDYSNGTLMRISGEMPQQLSEMWLRYSCLPQDPFTFCAMMWYEIWACIFLIIENTLILILSHCAFQKGSCTKVNNPHWEYYDQNQLHPPFTLLYVTLQIVPWDGPWDLGQTADECSAPSRLWWCWGGRGALLSHLGRQDLQHPHTPREGGLLETVMVRWMIFDWLTWQTCIPTDKFYLIEPLQQFETIL